MNILFEQPGTILFIGVIAEAIAIGGVVKTGRREPLIAAIVIPVLLVLLLGMERFVVTDEEQVRGTIHALARDVERNDLPAVLEHLSKEFPEGRKRAQVEFPRYRFDEVSVKNNLEVEVFPDNMPPKATATFNVTVVASDRGGMITNQKVARFVELTLYKEDDAWKVGAYDHRDPMEGMRGGN